jgi:hypothetical protein
MCVSTTPYRAAARVADRFAPSLDWTRRATVAMLAVAGALVMRVEWDLVFDRACDGQSTPHFALAAAVAAFTVVLDVTSVKLRREVARVVLHRVRVRSRIGDVAAASLALAPPLVFTLVETGAAFVIDFHATFRLCLSLGGMFGFGH